MLICNTRYAIKISKQILVFTARSYVCVCIPRKGTKYTLLLDEGLRKRAPMEDLGNKTPLTLHVIKCNHVGLGGWSVINDPLPPRHKSG